MFKLFKEMDLKFVALGIVLSAIRVAGMVALPTLTANIIDYGVMEGDMAYIFQQGFLMMAITVICIFFAVGAAYINSTQSQGLGEKLRNRAFIKILNFSNEDLDDFGTSSLITRTTNDVMQLQFVMLHFLMMLGLDPFLILGSATAAFIREPQLAVVFFITAPLLGIAIFFIIRAASPLFRKLQLQTDVINRIFREGLTGVRVVRAFNKTEYEENRFNEANEEFKSISVHAFFRLALFMPVMILVMSLTNILIVWFGTRLVGSGQMLVGNMVAFLTYAGLLMTGIMLLAQVLSFMPRGQIAAERIMAVLNHKSSINDDEHPEPISDEPVELTFDHVNFRYPGAEKLALANIDFEVKAGETLAVIGGTGTGKTSLANLMLRLYDVESGEIRLNGINIQHLSQYDLREKIGFAPQTPVLFSGTIRENLSYGRTDATDEEIWAALKVAQGAEFVRGLEAGLDSRVEHGGGNFSGGQRQRLSIARALVTDAEILIFDDSFSALDFKTDANLRAALKPVTEDKAVVIIAQRISTVVDADQILVLDNGELVGKGTHEELKQSNKIYQEIMNSQMKGDEL
ncbi:MAG TPA: ABC transporter ATP-binding protein [Alloiococcus sp.]|nr:ABC transporter ATP-binding protein [Alloiococcus sp.]